MDNHNMIQDGCHILHSDMFNRKTEWVSRTNQNNRRVSDFNELYRSKWSQDNLLQLYGKKYLK